MHDFYLELPVIYSKICARRKKAGGKLLLFWSGGRSSQWISQVPPLLGGSR